MSKLNVKYIFKKGDTLPTDFFEANQYLTENVVVEGDNAENYVVEYIGHTPSVLSYRREEGGFETLTVMEVYVVPDYAEPTIKNYGSKVDDGVLLVLGNWKYGEPLMVLDVIPVNSLKGSVEEFVESTDFFEVYWL